MKKQSAATGLILLTFTILSSCSILPKSGLHTKNWKGSDLPGHNYATFDYLNGTQKFDLKLNKKGPFYFKYETNIKSGKLHFSLESPTRVIISKELHGAKTDSIQVDNPANENFQIILIGSHAAGSVDFKYKEL